MITFIESIIFSAVYVNNGLPAVSIAGKIAVEPPLCWRHLAAPRIRIEPLFLIEHDAHETTAHSTCTSTSSSSYGYCHRDRPYNETARRFWYAHHSPPTRQKWNYLPRSRPRYMISASGSFLPSKRVRSYSSLHL